MDVQVEQVGPCKKQVAITIPPKEIKEKIEESYVQLRQTVDSSIDTNPMISGFRKGHVPQGLLERRFGDQVLEDVREALIAESYQKALEDNGLFPVGEPDFGELPEKIGQDQPLAFKVTVEVRPEFDIDGYKGIKVTKPSATVSDDEVDQRLEQFRHVNAELQKVEDGGAEQQDVLKCSLSVASDGQEIWTRPEAYAPAGGHGIAGISVEGFAELTKGVKAGEQREATVTLPEEFELEDWRGKPAQLVLKVDEIQRPVPPELTEAWARKVGFDSLEAVRDAIRREAVREKEQQVRRDLERQIKEQLVSMVDFELPEGVVSRYADILLMRGRVRLMESGVPEDELDGEVEKLRPASQEEAVRDTKLQFILDKIGQKEKLFATEEDMSRAIQHMALVYRRKPLEIAEQLRKEGGISELRDNVRERKIYALLLDEATEVAEGAAEPPPSQPASPSEPESAPAEQEKPEAQEES